MEEKARQYILHRFKSMSYFSNCVPFDYPPHMIRSDMEKAELEVVPTEDEIEETIKEAKCSTKDRILDLLRSGYSISRIREWCEYNPECTIPIPSVSMMNMNQLLSRFDYFNYELNRILREEQISRIMIERKEQGVLYDPSTFPQVFGRAGFSGLSDEFTRIELMSDAEAKEVILDAEGASNDILLSYLIEDADMDEVAKKAKENTNIIFSDAELPSVLKDLVREERYSIIIREVVRMGTSEMWNLINTMEIYKVWRLSRSIQGKDMEEAFQPNQMVEILKIYEKSRDSLKEGYLFQVSKLNNEDISQLIRLMQAYISWKGAFYYLPSKTAESDQDLSRIIVNGFSQEHGVDPSIFRMFLVRK